MFFLSNRDRANFQGANLVSGNAVNLGDTIIDVQIIEKPNSEDLEQPDNSPEGGDK